MDVSDIELIRTVSREGSLTQSSTILGLSQPTLSKKLARLEDQMAAQLFHRSTTGLVPTDVATYILSKAEPLRDQLSEIERHVELMTQLETGSLRLGVGPIIEQVLLPHVLPRFLDTTGDVQISIVTEDDDKLLALFNASEVDVIVGPFRASEWEKRDIVSISMVKDHVIAVARKGHPVFRSKRHDVSKLTAFPWAAPKAQGTARQAKGAQIIGDPKVVSDNYDLLKKLTLSSDAICAGPRAVFKEELASGLLRQLKVDLSIYWESALLVRPETLATRLAGHLVAMFKTVSGEVRELDP